MKNRNRFRWFMLFVFLLFGLSTLGSVGCDGGSSANEACVWNNSEWNNCNWQ